MHALRIAGVAASLAAAFSAPALAQSSTEVQIPLGDWLGEAATLIGPVLAAAVLWLIRRLPAQIASILMTMRVDQLITRAIDYGINATKDAAKDKPLTIDLGNQVLAKAAQYAVDHGPGGLLAWLGGEALLREKIIARLNVAADAEVVAAPAKPAVALR